MINNILNKLYEVIVNAARYSLIFPIEKIVSSRRLKQYHAKYGGKKRCFIIGNGPSLKNTDLSKLKGEYTFGLNRIYLLFKDLGFSTTFFVSVNKLLIGQCSEEISNLKIPKFISLNAVNEIKFDSYTQFVKPLGDPQFSTNILRGVWEGATVTYVAMQIAFYMGFDEVILIGVDHNFTTKGEPHKITFLKGNDNNHFSSEYFKGMKWQLPDLKTSELAYSIAKYQFEANGKKIFDATVNGKLDVFRKVSYNSLFKK